MSESQASKQNISSSRVIAGLGILTGNFAEGRDYIDIFIPLAAHCILSNKPSRVSVTDLQSQMVADFGMNLPQNVLKLVLTRATKQGLLKGEERTFIPNFEAIANMDFSNRYQSVISQQNAATQKLIRFASDRFNVELSQTTAENSLLAYIQKHDIEILECLLNVETPLVKMPQLTREVDFIVNSFIIDSYENDPEGFRYIDTIVKGHFLSNTLFFPDFSQIRRRFRRTAVYFDTALLLRILGYEGASRKAPCAELVNLLRREGAILKCFLHTRDEVYGVLYGCMSAMAKGDTRSASPTFRYLQRAGYGAEAIELELSILDKKIENAGIRIEDKPEYVHKYQIDEDRLDRILQSERVYWAERPRQRTHDVDCLSAVFRIRKGRDVTYIEESRAIFITANTTLCRIGTEFFVAERHINRGSVPIALTDYALTSLLWLKRPMLVPDLPTKSVIAECYAAVEPSERLWQKYMENVSRLSEEGAVSENEYYLLRYSQLAHKELMELTMGDEDMITEGTVQEILETLTIEIRKEDLEALSKEQRLRLEIERELSYERTLNENKWESVDQNIQRISSRIAHWLSITMFGALTLLVSFSALYGSIRWWGAWWNYAVLIAYILSFLVSTLDLWYGVRIKDWVSRFEMYLAPRIRNVVRKWFWPQT